MRPTECSAVRRVVATTTTSCTQPVPPNLQGPQPSLSIPKRHAGIVVLTRGIPTLKPSREFHLSTALLFFSSSWEPPNAQYWAQFHNVRPQGPEARRQQHKHNQRVLGYCLLLMLAGMGLHYVAFRCLSILPGSWAEGG